MSLPHHSALPTLLLRAAAVAVLLFASEGLSAAPSAAPPDPAAVEIQHRLDGATLLRIDGQDVDAQALHNFYRSRQWRPAWTDSADKLLAVLSSADLEGLPTKNLHLAAISSRRSAKPASPAIQADSDLLMTDALMRYATAMRGQRVNPTDFEDDWFIATPPFDVVAFLKEKSRDMASALIALQPPYASYQKLRDELAHLKAVAAAGDWPKIPTGPSIKPGATDDRILDVRKRLAATGELTGDDTPSTVYDENLQAAVQLFQQRHGLADDAVLGRQTVASMNVSATDRARQVAINMERWRWLPPKLENDHIVVNVPGAWMEVVEGGKSVLSMRTIVGDPDHPTPALHAKLTHMVLNPTWSVPASIATKEILPKLKKDPGYLVANDLVIVSDAFPPGSPESQGIGIDWHDRQSFPWQLRQMSGSDNALGRIKFAIPNNEDIYLHDTPNHKLFARPNRALSHGCVRLDKPDDLALYLLRDKDWTAEKLNGEIESGDTHTLSVSKAVPVWLLYWTAWVDNDGVLQLRDDLYGRDQRLATALSHVGNGNVMLARSAPPAPKVICEGCRTP